MKFLWHLLSGLFTVVVGYFINQLPNLPDYLKPWVPIATIAVLVVVMAIVSTQQEKRNAASAKTSKGNRQQGRDSSSTGDRLESLIQHVHHRCCEFIKRHHSTIKLINQQPIPVTDLYVDVYVLEDLAINRYVDPGRIDYDPEQDRLYMGTRRDAEPQDGIKIAEERDRLLILGKPGSGKSTFLKHLAEACRTGSFCPSLIPVLIMLGDIDASQFKLLDLIQAAFGDLVDTEQTKEILKRGRVLILLDGLDEVSHQYQRSVQDEIRDFSRNPDYDRNRYILTCRTHTSEYVVPGFEPPVEVADFDAPKIERFAQKWFEAIEGNPRGAELSKAFLEKLRSAEQERTAKLAVTPVLLDLVCWVYHGCEDLPSKRSDLYKTGVELLLRDLDNDKGVQRSANHPVFDRLKLTDKQNLLSRIAFSKFERSDNFRVFIRDEIVEDISEYLHLENREDGEGVLKAIAAHHGLLVERAGGIWSFSHLTFQEYFVARAIVAIGNSEALQRLTQNITEKRWREMFLLAASMMRDVDELVQAMKQKIDQMIVKDGELQQFLKWLSRKSISLNNLCYAQPVLRAYYFLLGFNYPRFREQNIAFALDQSLERVAADLSDDDTLLDYLHNFDKPDFDNKPSVNRFSYFKDYVNLLLEDFPETCEFRNFIIQTPKFTWEEYQKFDEWWQINGYVWTNQLRSLLIKHRNIGHDWQFTEAQEQLLRQYYDANKLLVDCLNSSCVSSAVKEAIEDTLLLPIEVSGSG